MKTFPIELLSLAAALAATLAATLIVHPALAHADAKSIWTNGKGIVSAADCKVSTSSQSVFKISQHAGESEQFENLRTAKGKSAVEVTDGSLVKLAESAEKESGRGFIQVVSAAKASAAFPAGKHSAVRLNEGYLPNESLKDIGDYVLELKNGTPKSALGHAHTQLQGSFWQTAMNGGDYVIYNCGQGPAKKVYLVFDVFVRDSIAPVTRVGVSPDETQIFRSVQTYTAEQAEKTIAAGSSMAPERPAQNHSLTAISSRSAAEPSSAQAGQTASPSAKAGAASPSAQPETVQSRTASHHANPPAAASSPAIRTAQPAATPAASSAATETRPDVPVIHGDLSFVVCIKSGVAQVRDQKLKKVIFTAKKGSEAMPMQTFGTDKQTKVIDGKNYSFIRVEFPGQTGREKIGWIASDLVKAKSQCPYVAQEQPAASEQAQRSDDSQPAMTITGLNDKNCCGFPILERPTASYKTGMRRFGANRSGGLRIHAACDLYRDDGDPVVAVAAGRVIMPKYLFYQGVYALEVRHPGGFVVRYGEILDRNARGIGMGSEVKIGQTVGYVGTVNSGCCSPMLHFELYSGEARGSLSQRDSEGFQRRSDLMDPTKYLSKWEQKKFGESF